MKVSYDQKNNTKYIKFRSGKVIKSRTLFDWLILDLNQKNEVIGLEILNFSKRYIVVTTDGKNLESLCVGVLGNQSVNINDETNVFKSSSQLISDFAVV